MGRSQVTVVNGVQSSCRSLECGVPQGSILGPLFFILYVYSLPGVLPSSNVFLYADDTTIAVSRNNIQDTVNCLNSELNCAHKWLQEHELSLNASKTRVMFFGTAARLPKHEDIHVSLGNTEIKVVNNYKYLSLTLDSRLSFRNHVEEIRRKSIPKINTLGRISRFVSKDTILYLYRSLVLSRIEYADIIYDGLQQGGSDCLQRLQNYGLRTILHCPPRTPTAELHRMANISVLSER